MSWEVRKGTWGGKRSLCYILKDVAKEARERMFPSEEPGEQRQGDMKKFENL